MSAVRSSRLVPPARLQRSEGPLWAGLERPVDGGTVTAGCLEAQVVQHWVDLRRRWELPHLRVACARLRLRPLGPSGRDSASRAPCGRRSHGWSACGRPVGSNPTGAIERRGLGRRPLRFERLALNGRGGIRTHGTFRYTGFQDQLHRPLGHPTKAFSIADFRFSIYRRVRGCPNRNSQIETRKSLPRLRVSGR